MRGRAKTRGDKLLLQCKKAHTILENDGNYYCYGIIDMMYDEPIGECKVCKAYVRNIEEAGR